MFKKYSKVFENIEKKFKNMEILKLKTYLWNGKEIYVNYVDDLNFYTIKPFYLEILR